MHLQTASNCLVVCAPQWTEFPGQFSLNGVCYNEYQTVTSCQDYCITVSTCVAVDFNFLNSSCRLHFNSDHLSGDSTIPDFVTDQYRLDRSCSTTAVG